jgi:hypothetical protein
LISNPGVPEWWPAFCSSIDFYLGAWPVKLVADEGVDKPIADGLRPAKFHVFPRTSRRRDRKRSAALRRAQA